jgi:hypothetical protein
MPTKDRLLVLLQTLQEQSDDETWLTTADIRKALEKEGHESLTTLLISMTGKPWWSLSTGFTDGAPHLFRLKERKT